MNKKIQLLITALMLLVGVQVGYAAVSNPPESLLDAPTQDAATVTSFFSDAYTNATTFKNFSGTTNATEKSVKTILGKDMLYIAGGLNSWDFVNFNTPVDISNCEKLSFDVYVVSGAFDIKVRLSSTSSGYQIPTKLQEGWNRVEVTLDEMKTLATPPNLKSVSSIGFINGGGQVRTIYISNIFAYGSSTSGPVDPVEPQLPQPAPTPTQKAADVKSIFSDTYTNLTQISKFDGTGTGKILDLSATNKIIKIEDGLNHWANIHFATPMNIENMETFHIDVNVVRDAGSVTLKFGFDDGLGVVISRVLNPGWNSLDIPLSEFKTTGTVLSEVSRLRIIREGGYAQTVYIDNIYTYGITGGEVEPADPNAPKTQAPTPLHKAEDVLSIFSNAYTNITTLVQNNKGTPICEMTVLTPFSGDDVVRFTSLNWTLIKFDPLLDLSEMDYIHFDVWAEGTPKIKMGLGGWASQPTTDALSLVAGWNSFDIPMSVFRNAGVDLTQLIVMRLVSNNGFAIPRIYVDNIYAYKGDPISDKPVPTYEIKSAPEPIVAHTNVKSVFTEKYTNLTAVTATNAGTTTDFKEVYLTEKDPVWRMRSLGELEIKANTVLNLADMENIHFSIYLDPKGGAGALQIGLQAKDSDKKVYSSVVPTLVADNWMYVNIPLKELKDAGVDLATVETILFKGSGNIYIDNVYAFKGAYTEGLGEEGKITMDWDKWSQADVLPDRNSPFLGVNLATGSGGEMPGVFNTNYSYPTFKDLYYVKSKGIRLIRLPFRWERVQHEVNGPLDNDLDFAKIKEVIAEAERIGIYVMPDMHDYCRRRINGVTYKFGDAQLTNAHFADVWTKLASELKDFTNIWGYDIMNEPYGLLPGIWDAAAQAAINGIRTVDTKTHIVIEGGNYAASYSWPTTAGSLINLVDPSDKIIFQAHCYFDQDKSGHYLLEEFDKEVSSPTEHIDRIKPFVNWLKEHNKTGILGEFGVPRSDARWLNLLEEVVVYLKENGINGTYWVGGSWYAGDKVSVQPLEDYTVERAQMRILEKYTANFGAGMSIEENISNGEGRKIEVNAYPNPVDDILTIRSQEAFNMVRILNLSGQVVSQAATQSQQIEVNVATLPQGVYLLQVTFENGESAMTKIVKK